MVVVAMKDEYFDFKLLLTSSLYGTGKQLQLNWLQASLLERERERECVSALSAKHANLIIDRSISSIPMSS